MRSRGILNIVRRRHGRLANGTWFATAQWLSSRVGAAAAGTDACEALADPGRARDELLNVAAGSIAVPLWRRLLRVRRR